MFEIERSNRFKKQLKLCKKQQRDMVKLKEVIIQLATPASLPPKNKDHNLTGNWKNYRECHITPDWLLIYQIDHETKVLYLIRTGSHSELFR